MKKCNKCSQVKEFTDFFKDKHCSDGHYSICKLCKTSSTDKWRQNNREHYNASMRKYQKVHRRRLHYKKEYGIELQDYYNMWDAQQGKCKICNEMQKGRRPLVIDHCHKTGVIRGLLCYGCNRGLSMIEDDKMHTKALEYLKK